MPRRTDRLAAAKRQPGETTLPAADADHVLIGLGPSVHNRCAPSRSATSAHAVKRPPMQEQERPTSPDKASRRRTAGPTSGEVDTSSPGTRRLLLVGGVVALVVVAVVGFGLFRAQRAARAGTEGKTALLRAEENIGDRQLDAARRDLQRARSAFIRMRGEIEALGPLRPLAGITPFVRVQLRGVEAFSDAGLLLADAGLALTDTAGELLEPADPDLPISAAIDALRSLELSMSEGVAALDAATERVASLDGFRLVGPLGDARRELVARLNRVGPQAAAAEEGLGALLTFLGDAGPRRYLIFTQNPDEVRPTGGYIGTYGVLSAAEGDVALERYDSSENWYRANPEAVVPPEEASTAFQIPDPPVAQTIANVNALPDWTLAGELAAELWERGGEDPVEGALSLTPEFLARILKVVGPVEVPEYSETVTAKNVIERTDFYTHRAEVPEGRDRKDFLAVLADIVVQRLLAAPASSWGELGQAAAEGFDAREAMVWSTDGDVADAVARREWDGVLPQAAGDFFFQAEFEYSAKNGRGLERTYGHQVELRPDGSGRVTTDITIANTQPFDPSFNIDSLSFITIYGPEGAVVDQAASDPGGSLEEPLAGHPGAAWVRAAEPLGETTLKVVWDVPDLAQRRDDGTWAYQLRWMSLPGHTGDIVNLVVTPPEGWQWQGPAPPERVELDDELVGTWVLTP